MPILAMGTRAFGGTNLILLSSSVHCIFVFIDTYFSDRHGKSLQVLHFLLSVYF